MIQHVRGGPDHHAQNIKRFAYLLLISQVIIIVLFGVFVRIEKNLDESLNRDRYPAYQDINVMMLIGFGYLMAFTKAFSWSAFAYTFFLNALLPQLYILLSGFWMRVLKNGFNESNYYIYVNQTTFSLGLYSAASMYINIGATVGRIGPLQMAIICLVHEIGYTLNEVVCLEIIHAFDVGGSMVIHTYGAYGGLLLSFLLARNVKPDSKAETSYTSNIFAFIGTLFLWMYWPSFNFGVLATTPFAKSQIITHTILSLTGSCLSTFMTSAFLKDKFTMEHLLNATLCGGVVIGAAAGILFNPGAALAIGFLCGIISTLGYQYLTPYLEERFGIYDTCGVHNLHGIPGFIGGIIGAIAAATYKLSTTTDSYIITNNDFPYYNALINNPYKQGGLQIAATFISIGISLFFSFFTFLLIRLNYNYHPQQFFHDYIYFDEAAHLLGIKLGDQILKSKSFKQITGLDEQFRPKQSTMNLERNQHEYI